MGGRAGTDGSQRSRPFVTITSTYASSLADSVEIDREVVNQRVNGKSLDLYSSIHAAVSYNNLPRVRETDEGSALSGFAGRERKDAAESEHFNTVAFEFRDPGDFAANAVRLRGRSSRAAPVTAQNDSGYEERLFHTHAEEAMDALGAATKDKNEAALATIFGPDNLKLLLTGVPGGRQRNVGAVCRKFRTLGQAPKSQRDYLHGYSRRS